MDHFSQLTKRINTTIKPSEEEEEERSSGALPLLAVRRGPWTRHNGRQRSGRLVRIMSYIFQGQVLIAEEEEHALIYPPRRRSLSALLASLSLKVL